jgi:hypothetical protein
MFPDFLNGFILFSSCFSTSRHKNSTTCLGASGARQIYPTVLKAWRQLLDRDGSNVALLSGLEDTSQC